MPLIDDICQFVAKNTDCNCLFAPQAGFDLTPITGISRDQDAVPGDLAWISAKHVANTPDRVKHFRGSLLICPPTVEESLWHSLPLLVCENPKLAFIRAATEYFSHLAETRWPSYHCGEPVATGSIVSPSATLAKGVVVGSNTEIKDNVVIGPNTVIANATIKEGVIIGANCAIGLPGFGFEKDGEGHYWRFPHFGRVRIDKFVEIGSNTCIDRGALGDTVIGRGCKIDNLVHIAHNVVIGVDTVVIANSMLGGSVSIGERAWIAPSVSILNQKDIGESALIGMGSVVIRDVSPGTVHVGNPARQIRRENNGE